MADHKAARARPEAVRVAGAGNRATPVDRAGKADMLIAAVRPMGRPSSFWIWGVADNLTSGTAQNAVRIALSRLEQGLGRSEA